MTNKHVRTSQTFPLSSIPVIFSLLRYYSHVQVFEDLPKFSLGDIVSVVADDRKLARVFTLQENVAQYFSLVS